jgi:hypothetical protein
LLAGDGEVAVDMGGPERDEGGLPPVDVEIPDDARELDRDVQAYHRELRAARRRRRVERFVAPFTRHGIVVPMIAGTLALTLFAGTMLTVITSTPEPSSMPAPLLTTPASVQAPPPASVPPAGRLGGPLPSAAVWIGNKPLQLTDLRPAVLAIIPPACRCLTTMRQLALQAGATQVKIYFVGAGAGFEQLTSLAAQAGGRAGQVVEDKQNVLAKYYQPAGLTAILVHSDSAVSSVERNLIPGVRLEAKLRRLGMPALGIPASPTPG